ncbi:uncharacterized protein LOC106760102 [Vigna radiata var. radiata]|uniref:Uncharacterized protein LOC106760102 n=1 Tax=Vigna radiata var. radiata TaxID=3916 RepID=A0A1S3TZ17_VIGRR|nr:uncharacterized protein LOC106760102 [Vigna radiata var. radiata]
MEEGDRVGDFFSQILTIANQMKTCGEAITNTMIIEKIMRSLQLMFDHIVVAIEESRDLGKLKIEELQSSLEAYEMRMRERNSVKRDDQALKVKHVKVEEKKKSKKWEGKSRKGKWKKEGSGDTEEPDERSGSTEKKHFKKGSKKKDKRNTECFNCHKYGHFASECFLEKANQKNSSTKEKEAHVVQEDSDTEMLTLMGMTTTECAKPVNKN